MNDQPNPTPAPSGPVQSESLPVGRISDEEVKRATPQCWTKNHAREDGTFDEDKYAAGYNACVEPTPTPPQPAPDRHEASRAAFEAAFWPSAVQRTPHEYHDQAIQRRWEDWCRALDHAAQEQPAPEPQGASLKDKGYWECQRCGEGVDPRNVTYAEHHDGGCGGACEWVDLTPEPQRAAEGSAREWVKKWLLPLEDCDGRPLKALHEKHALELADRADAAERRLASSERARKSLSDACDYLEAKIRAVREQRDTMRDQAQAEAHDCRTLSAQLAAAQAENAKLQEVAESLVMAMETVRLDRKLEDDGNVWALQTLEWAEWLMEKATEARAALTPNTDTK